MKKFAVLIGVMVILLGSYIGVSAERKVTVSNELTPELYNNLEMSKEELLNHNLEDEYSFTYVDNSNVCICTNQKDESEWVMMFRPVRVSYEREDTIVYTSENGSLMYWKTNEPLSEARQVAESVHTLENEKEGMVLLDSTPEMAVVYSVNEKVVKCWKNSILVQEWQLPQEAVFCGMSPNLGYIFRANRDVYALTVNAYCTGVLGEKVYAIAHGVKSVVLANYTYDEYNYGTPLFQMENGELKAYVNNDENLGKELDSEKYLKKPLYEGGYYIPSGGEETQF